MAPTKIAKSHIEKAQRKSVLDFGNDILYDLCDSYPYHKKVDQIIAKIWLIGRSYAAAIERRKNATEDNDTFYKENVGQTIKDSNIDEWINGIEDYRFPTIDNIEYIVNVHGNLMNLFIKITGMGKRSLASKYLHFHRPKLFFIYDSRSMRSISIS